MIIKLPLSGSCLLVSGVAPDQAEDSLSLSVWEVYSDAVILDWYITLTQKFRSVNYVINTISWSKDENCRGPNVLNVKEVVAAFNQEKALVGAFSVITNLRMDFFEALVVRLVRRCNCNCPVLTVMLVRC